MGQCANGEVCVVGGVRLWECGGAVGVRAFLPGKSPPLKRARAVERFAHGGWRGKNKAAHGSAGRLGLRVFAFGLRPPCGAGPAQQRPARAMPAPSAQEWKSR